MVDPPLVSQRDGPLPGAALALPHQEAAVDPAAEEVLRGVPRHGPMVPGVLLQAVHRGDVVAGDPALPILGLRLAPFPVVVVAQDPELFAFPLREKEKESLRRPALGFTHRCLCIHFTPALQTVLPAPPPPINFFLPCFLIYILLLILLLFFLCTVLFGFSPPR